MFEHETALQELDLKYADLPRSLRGSIDNFKRARLEAEADPENKDLQLRLKRQSIVIADALQDYKEELENLPDQTQTPNNMLTGSELERAQAVGLTETATLAEVEAKEAEIKSAAEKTAADEATEKAEAEAKAAVEKQAAEKQAVEKQAAEKLAADEAEAKAKTEKEALDANERAKAEQEAAAQAIAEKEAAEAQAKADWLATPLGAIGM